MATYWVVLCGFLPTDFWGNRNLVKKSGYSRTDWRGMSGGNRTKAAKNGPKWVVFGVFLSEKRGCFDGL
jgi:hypothetical protein